MKQTTLYNQRVFFFPTYTRLSECMPELERILSVDRNATISSEYEYRWDDSATTCIKYQVEYTELEYAVHRAEALANKKKKLEEKKTKKLQEKALFLKLKAKYEGK